MLAEALHRRRELEQMCRLLVTSGLWRILEIRITKNLGGNRMSHFTVAVFSDGTKSVEELLAPYQENNMGDCPKKYLKFISESEENRKIW